MTGVARALFRTPGSGVLTVGLLALLAWVLPPLWHWAIEAATWSAPNRRGCAADGACWAFIRARLGLFFYGGFPPEQRWRTLPLTRSRLLALTSARQRGF